ncbi:probable glutamate receptor [Panulirus ornatus]|uniref:probable glutamate receptor n=1 Tax=Panulirus ornatus TaxID=150431 RepID=UPI003A89572D
MVTGASDMNYGLCSSHNVSSAMSLDVSGKGAGGALPTVSLLQGREMGVQSLRQLNLSSHAHWDDNLFSERPHVEILLTSISSYLTQRPHGEILLTNISSYLTERLQDFMGHTLQVVTLSYFPFTDYQVNNEDTDGVLAPLDSLDTRILNTFAAHFNFTYEMREPWDGTWGVPLGGGNWSGIVGTLQHHKADFSLNLTPSAPRMRVISHSRIYSYDPLLIISLKPRPLPRHLALMRPFAGEVWITIIIYTSVSGVILWILESGWSRVSGHRTITFASSVFYSWGLLLEEPAAYIPPHVSGQVLVGSWLLSCVIIGTGYRSSLVAHLSVQSKSLPINTFQDLLNREGWSWGRWNFGGTTLLYFSESSDPVLREIEKDIPVYEVDEGVERVLEGGFSYIAYKSQIKYRIVSLYFDKYGNTPLHLSTTEYPVLGGNSWGVRQGAPFLSQFRRMKQRLIEVGLVDFWMDDVIKIKGRHLRADRDQDERGRFETGSVADGQVVLGLNHLQGVFYLLFLGYVAACIASCGESLASRYTLHQRSHLKKDDSIHGLPAKH